MNVGLRIQHRKKASTPFKYFEIHLCKVFAHRNLQAAEEGMGAVMKPGDWYGQATDDMTTIELKNSTSNP